MIAILKKRSRAGGKSAESHESINTWWNDGSLRPVDLYCYLWSRFGHPNGLMMMLRSDRVPNIFDWHWTLSVGSVVIDFMGGHGRTEILVRECPRMGTEDWLNLIADIKHDFAKHGKSMSEVRSRLESWQIMVNPYKRLKDIVESLWSDVQGINLTKPPYPAPPYTEDELRAYLDQFNEWTSQARKVIRSGATLRLMLPVFTEAFVNVLARILSKPDKRNDERLLTEFERRPVDVRVKTLHEHCRGFERPVDGSSSEFNDWHTLMNERNALLHGSLNHQLLACGLMYYDGQLPVLASQESPLEQAIERQLSFAVPGELEKRFEVAARFITFILSHLRPKMKAMAEIVMNSHVIGYDKARRMYGAVSPETPAEGFPGPMT